MKNLTTIITESETSDKFYSDIFKKSFMYKQGNIFTVDDEYDVYSPKEVYSLSSMEDGIFLISRFECVTSDYEIIKAFVTECIDKMYVSKTNEEAENGFMKIYDSFEKDNLPFKIYLNDSKKEVSILIAKNAQNYNDNVWKQFRLFDLFIAEKSLLFMGEEGEYEYKA